MSKDQQCMVWYLMYQLKALDQHPRSASLGERLRGIIKRELHVDVTSEQPFLWLDYQQGSLLIERLKKYVSSAARKRLSLIHIYNFRGDQKSHFRLEKGMLT